MEETDSFDEALQALLAMENNDIHDPEYYDEQEDDVDFCFDF